MIIYILLALLGLVIPVSAQLVLDKEGDFLGIPGVDSVSNNWIFDLTDSSDFGFLDPKDVDVLRLSPSDYRLIILDSGRQPFVQFRIDQENGLGAGDIVHSAEAPEGCASARAMCQVRSADYFDSQTDRVAVAFARGAQIGIYSFSRATGQFALDETISNPEIIRPVGIYWAFNQFFIVDDSVRTIFRVDSTGSIISSYGHAGMFDDGYDQVSDIAGYVDQSNTAHLYVGDGNNERVDHLTATAGDPDIYFHSQALAWLEGDTLGLNTHEVAYVPSVGIIGLNRWLQRLSLWYGSDSLQVATRSDKDSLAESPLIHIRYVCGRLVISALENGDWSLRSYAVDGAAEDNPEPPLPTGQWTIEMSPIIVSDSLHIVNGDSLTIDAGVEVFFDQDAALVVDSSGKLVISGTANDHVLFDAKDAGETWGGVYVDGGWLNVIYADIYNTDLCGIFADMPSGSHDPLIIENCYLDGSTIPYGGNVLRLWGSPTLRQTVLNTTIGNVPDGSGMYLYNCYVNFDGVTVEGCDVVNSYIKQVTGTFRNCTFTDRASEYAVLFNNAGTTPNFQCCTFADLAPTSGTYTATVYAIAGTAPTFGWENSQNGVSNTFSDSSAKLLYMSGYPVLPIIDNVKVGGGAGGRNDWYQKNDQNGKFIYWYNLQGLTQYSAENQYWQMGTRTYPTSSDFYAGGGVIDFNPWKTPAWELCGGSGASLRDNERTDERGGAGLDDGVDYDSLFTLALAEEIAENFEAAQPLFTTVATESDDDQLRWQALTHIVSTQRHLDAGDGEALIPDLIDGAITADSSAYESFVYGNRLLASYRTDRAEYDEAIDICTMLLGSGLTHDDSVIVAIELVGIQMLSGDFEEGGGLDGGFGNPVPAGLCVTSVAHGLELENQLLNALGVEDVPTYQPNVIPTSYQLYQNYPNPFNPLTEIRFDLPEKAHVELIIFNTLGQRVATLIDEPRAAGTYRMSWDGSSVASGVYLYQLKAGSFVETKKMILLR